MYRTDVFRSIQIRVVADKSVVFLTNLACLTCLTCLNRTSLADGTLTVMGAVGEGKKGRERPM